MKIEIQYAFCSSDRRCSSMLPQTPWLLCELCKYKVCCFVGTVHRAFGGPWWRNCRQQCFQKPYNPQQQQLQPAVRLACWSGCTRALWWWRQRQRCFGWVCQYHHYPRWHHHHRRCRHHHHHHCHRHHHHHYRHLGIIIVIVILIVVVIIIVITTTITPTIIIIITSLS